MPAVPTIVLHFSSYRWGVSHNVSRTDETKSGSSGKMALCLFCVRVLTARMSGGGH